MHILVATDLSARSDRALARGVLLARSLDAKLDILHVVSADLPAEFRAHAVDWARKSLQRETERLAKDSGVQAGIDVREGDPTTDIVRLCGLRETDLIVLGVHGQGDAGAKAFAATTAGKALRSSLTAALIVGDEATGPYRNVVIGVDFTMFSRVAMRQALQIAPTACLHLVHAYHAPFQGFLAAKSVKDEAAYQQRLELDAFLQDEMDALTRRARESGLGSSALQTVIEEGQPEKVLRDTCAKVDADLLVIGTHSRTGLTRAIWGSVAEGLLDNPPCDVLVIKPF